MEVSVYALDLCVILVHTLDQNRNGVIQLCTDVMAAMAGNNLKSAVATGTTEDRFTNTIGLDGLKQVFIVLRFTVYRKRVIQKVFQIGRMDGHAVNLSLTGDRQLEEVCFRRSIQPILKHLGHGRAFRPICGTGSRSSILRLFRRFLRHRRLGRFIGLFNLVRLGGSGGNISGLISLDRLIVLGGFGGLLHLVGFIGSKRSRSGLAILGCLIVLGRFGGFLHLVSFGGSDRSRSGLAILDRLIVLGRFGGLLHLVSFGGSDRSRSGLAILGRLIVFSGFGRLLHLVRFVGCDRRHSGLAILGCFIVFDRLGGLLALVRINGSRRCSGRLAILGRFVILGRPSGLFYLVRLGGRNGSFGRLGRDDRCLGLFRRFSRCGSGRCSGNRCPKRTNQRVFLFVGH